MVINGAPRMKEYKLRAHRFLTLGSNPLFEIADVLAMFVSEHNSAVHKARSASSPAVEASAAAVTSSAACRMGPARAGRRRAGEALAQYHLP